MSHMVRLTSVLLVLMLFMSACAGRVPTIPSIKEIGEMSGLKMTDEERIVAVLDDVQRGMEARQIYKVLAYVSRNYYDEQGRDYAAIEAYLTELFKKYRAIRITRVVPRVSVSGDTARAVETFGSVAEPLNSAVDPPINLQGQVAVNLEKVDGKWQIVEWSEIL